MNPGGGGQERRIPAYHRFASRLRGSAGCIVITSHEGYGPYVTIYLASLIQATTLGSWPVHLGVNLHASCTLRTSPTSVQRVLKDMAP